MKKLFWIVFCLLQLELSACSKKNDDKDNTPKIVAADATKIIVQSGFGWVDCFPAETFELVGLDLSYKRKMKDESCEIKSTDSTKVLTQDQRDLLIKKIESLRFKAWAQPCNSDYATQTVEIMRSNSSIKYHVYLCKEGYYIEYEDFFDLLKTMNQLTT